MQSPCRYVWLLSLSIVLPSGCARWHVDAEPVYQTIEANPRRNTERAERQHHKALKIIRRHLDRRHFHADLHEAEDHLQRALVADVTYGPAHNSLGVLYLWRRDLYLAAWEFEYAQKLMPESCEPLYNLGIVYEEAGKLDQAIEYYQMALDIEPTNPHVLGNLARARIRYGDPIEAVRPLLEELRFADKRPDWLAWAAEQLGLNPIQFVSAEEPDLEDDEPTPAESAETPEEAEEIPPFPFSSEAAPELPPLDAPPGTAHLGDEQASEPIGPTESGPFAPPLLSE